MPVHKQLTRDESTDDTDTHWSGWEPKDRLHPNTGKCMKYAVLCRTNSTLVRVAAALLRIKRPFLFVGGVAGYNLTQLIALCDFFQQRGAAHARRGGRGGKAASSSAGEAGPDRHRQFLAMFRSVKALEAFAEATGNADLLSRIQLVQRVGPDSVRAMCKSIIREAKRHEDRDGQPAPRRGEDVVSLSTVHKCKGLEYDCVQVVSLCLRSPHPVGLDLALALEQCPQFCRC